MNTIENLFQDEQDDVRTVEFIRNYLPQELKAKFTDDELYYFLDVIVDYYATSGILDQKPDKHGFVEIDQEKIVNHIIETARKEEMGEYDPEELLFVVEGEMEYGNSDSEEE